MENLTKYNNPSNLYITRAEERALSHLLRGLTPEPKQGVHGLPLPTLYSQRNGTRPPGIMACHNAQVAAGRFPIWETVAGWSNHVLVPLPKPGMGGAAALLFMEAVREFGDVGNKLRAMCDPASPGGAKWTKAERAELRREALQAIAKLHQVMEAQP